MDSMLIPEGLSPNKTILGQIDAFRGEFEPLEIGNGSPLVLHVDKKSQAYYLVCHLDGSSLVTKCDLEATIEETDDDVIYKLNRDITEDPTAYRLMESDAIDGRSFEDLVVEYDKSYRRAKPLKVYGGQHRVQAIAKALNEDVSEPHGVRVYFNLSADQKVEIAIVSNTSIAVPNDLLDRMREQLAGSELRDWCQAVGLLAPDEDFAEKRDPETPTVRIARTLLVNFFAGRRAEDEEFHQPIVCKSGGIDEDYEQLRDDIDWSDSALFDMGQQFARLHKMQRQTVLEREEDRYAEFARKALSLSVVASWAYAAGLFQGNQEYLENHYSLPDAASPPDDPLNAKALSQARHKAIDPDTYRGLGTRYSAQELGRMLEVFLVQAVKASQRGITKNLATAAIQSYEAKKATHEASRALGKT